MDKGAIIWLSFLTVLYVANLIGDVLEARRLRNLAKRVRELEEKLAVRP